jgi:hypothetical protein
MTRLPDPISPEIRAEMKEAFGERPGDPDAEGWAWTDVWFDRAGAEAIAGLTEHATILRLVGENPGDISGQTMTIAKVFSVDDILEMGGYEELGRALAGVQLIFRLRLDQLMAGARPDEDEPA